ncbi:heme ABC transporter ATP-binding protein [Thermosipho melanesiensis]|uniref:ABC transporter related n=1 Tax=Thermosipho melanesiensis (strain DSM 12029 / CIP 104789 / BI429) TaxID=391009 RepID=A6LIZ6_THEM4|nr:ABC transporter related [Thermosipho melanesiensis BI429]OOC38505.1 heme ABC transporter ATP-binding protein [Thermosipho melanesiensis]OOC40309.1 heme ABC transporter ATP-binding protein [Thermosipho melanesiensis]OOC40573.1 heme ABC transporter ATP-binding protein [Thermosipho melanesiensis]OOC44420.1 heme ABC transporter ATP-binding protein [Thermosipho melanesiensis]
MYAVEMVNIVKKFPGVLANDHVTIRIKKGEIHAIVGENGAGKSTLMNQLYGLYHPDEGEIYINGNKVEIKGPKDAIKNGIGMVHQHFMLVDTLTVAENIVLGSEPIKGLNFDLNKARKEVQELSEKYGLYVDVDAKIEDISVGMQQRVEILKTLYRGANIIILDEPTAVLTPQEVEELFEIMRKLKNDGKTILFISHKLHEVMEISERITVMRLGKVTGELETSKTNPKEIARHMVGRDVVLRVEKKPHIPKDVVFEIKDLVVKDNRGLIAVNNISFSIKKGEIVGIAGVAGNGQTELVEAITGLRKIESGKIFFEGKDVTNHSPKQLRELGLSHIPEDRLKHGLIEDFEAYYNVILGQHYKQPFSNGTFLNHQNIFEYTKNLMEEFDVRPRRIEHLGGNFSGGNQQKLVVGREIRMNPKFLVVAQPTRGLDVGAIEFIHKQILNMREKDTGILLISMELEEIFSLSDRILVMYEGEIMGEVKPEETTVEEVGLMMIGQRLEEVRRG